ncbi:MAG: hypothetical protein UY73_C0026G0002 [Parcubacteria group bacterium GW2011_GWA2_52_8]|nr:MAG: hypothetical protein UY73_C0026G0002 [Parcubacteria group bacterium GW2011_GWA2_52_8]
MFCYRHQFLKVWCRGKSAAGFSTLEIMIALAIVVLSVSAVILVSFGSQFMGVDAQTNDEAIYKAEAKLEPVRSLSRSSFAAVRSDGPVPDGMYSLSTEVTDISPCAKYATVRVNWQNDIRPLETALHTKLTSPADAHALAGDCAAEPPEAGWTDPDTLGSADLVPSGSQATGLDVVGEYAYVTAVHATAASPDFFVFDLSDPADPQLVGSVNTGKGLNAVDVAGSYAFVAHNATNTQLQVIDISNPAAPSLIASASRTLPGVGASYPEGQIIYYYDNHVFIGTYETAGNEFHAYDVSNALNPQHRGSFSVNHNVHDIVVRGPYAYLALSSTSDSAEELLVLNVNNPSAITEVGSYNPPGTHCYATALYALGTRLFLGMGKMYSQCDAALPDFYVLDISLPFLPTLLGSADLDLGNNNFVSGIIVSGNLAFLSLSQQTAGFQVWAVADPTTPQNLSTLNYAEKAVGLDFENDYIFTANESNNALRVIYDNP